jgi:hypothetical protein
MLDKDWHYRYQVLLMSVRQSLRRVLYVRQSLRRVLYATFVRSVAFSLRSMTCNSFEIYRQDE